MGELPEELALRRDAACAGTISGSRARPGKRRSPLAHLKGRVKLEGAALEA